LRVLTYIWIGHIGNVGKIELVDVDAEGIIDGVDLCAEVGQL
jgi:hypothetical protein